LDFKQGVDTILLDKMDGLSSQSSGQSVLPNRRPSFMEVKKQLSGIFPVTKQLSAFFPSRRTEASSPRRAAIMKLGLFVFFVATRALHPLFIDASKEDGKILYAKNTPVFLNKFLTIILMNLVAFLGDGVAGVRECWQPKCLAVFGMIGAVYAVGDTLEMLSMSSLSGGVYQTLLQTKLLITALLVWWLKGQRQTPLQWHVLISMFVATSAFVLVDMDSSSDSGGASAVPVVGVVCTLLKVAASCYCAVLSEKYLKAYKDMSLPAKISALSTTWMLASLLTCVADPKVRSAGFFAHWTPTTWVVTVSFIVKTVSTMYLLQALDSVQKNIGEALAVIVIYISQVQFSDKSFELSVFLLAMLVVGLVKTYLVSAPPKSAAQKSKRVRVVDLNKEGTDLMRNMGFSTIRCEAAESLPDGVFYGMLGDVHPVCGTRHQEDERQCELMMLSHPPVGSDEHPAAAAKEALFLPNKSLTVLGQVRDRLPREQLTAQQFTSDLVKARGQLASCLEGP
jgi:drug/metabolite transporter (DMT)-like permease